MTTNRHDEVVKLTETGATYAEVGHRLGITKQRVGQILKPKPRRQKADLQSKVMLTTRDVAHLLGVHNNTVRRWSRTGILKSYRISSRGDLRFRQENVGPPTTRREDVAQLETRVFELAEGRYQNLSELAQAMGISSTQLYRVRQGKRHINRGFIVGAIKAFPIHSLDELFYIRHRLLPPY